MPPPESPDAPLFRERRRVPWWWWLVALAVAVPSVEVVVVFAPEMTSHGGWLLAAVAFAVTVVAVSVLLVSLSRSDVEVDRRGLRVDRDFLPTAAIGRVRVLDRPGAHALLGRDARADAHLSIRPWIYTALQIEVCDLAAHVPYWVVGTRRPEELAATLEMLRSPSSGDEPRANQR